MVSLAFINLKIALTLRSQGTFKISTGLCVPKMSLRILEKALAFAKQMFNRKTLFTIANGTSRFLKDPLLCHSGMTKANCANALISTFSTLI